MRFIKNYFEYIKENYNQALSLGQKANIDINPVLEFLIGGYTTVTTDKYPIPYNVDNERKFRVYIGLFTRLYIENDQDLTVLFPIHDWIHNNPKGVLYIRNNNDNSVTPLNNILDIYKLVEKNNDGRTASETLSDAIIDFNKNRVAQSWIKEMPSILKQEIKIPENMERFRDIMLLYYDLPEDDQKVIYSKFFGNGGSTGKISAYKSITNFLNDISSIVKSYNLTFDDLLGIVNSRKDVDIIYQDIEKQILAVSVHTFEASNILGEKTSWCISREKSYFDNYYNKGYDQLVFIFNFSEPDVLMSKIGVNMNINNSFGTAHDKNDDRLEEDEVLAYLKKYDIPADTINYHETEISRMVVDINEKNVNTIHAIFRSDNNEYKKLCVDILDISILSGKILNQDIVDFLDSDISCFQELMDITSRKTDNGYKGRIMRKYPVFFLKHSEYFDIHSDDLNAHALFNLAETDAKLFDDFFQKTIQKSSRIMNRVLSEGLFIVYFAFDDLDPNVLKKYFDFSKHIIYITTQDVLDIIEYLYTMKNIDLKYIQDYLGINKYEISKYVDKKYYIGTVETIDSYLNKLSSKIITEQEFFNNCENYIKQNGVEKFKKELESTAYSVRPRIITILLENGFDNSDDILPFSQIQSYSDEFIHKYFDSYFSKIENIRDIDYYYLINRDTDFSEHLYTLPAKTLYDLCMKDVNLNKKGAFDMVYRNLFRIDKQFFKQDDPLVVCYLIEDIDLTEKEERYIVDNFEMKDRTKYFDNFDISEKMFDLLDRYNKLPKNVVLRSPKNLPEEWRKIGEEKYGLKVV
jgi:hypothetical protein